MIREIVSYVTLKKQLLFRLFTLAIREILIPYGVRFRKIDIL